MADVIQKEHKQKSGVRRSKKSSLRVDLTPMVDLGFLLIAFFVFTTTIQQQTAMKLGMPDDKKVDNPTKASEKKTLNIILGANNKVYTYDGLDSNNIKGIGDNTKLLRQTIIEKKNAIRNEFGNDSDMTVLIKPTVDCSYANVVNALDEMLINNIKTYVMVDADANETAATGHK